MEGWVGTRGERASEMTWETAHCGWKLVYVYVCEIGKTGKWKKGEHTSESYTKTTTIVSLVTFSMASRYPNASTSSNRPYLLTLGLVLRFLISFPSLFSSSLLCSLHLCTNSSSSLALPSPSSFKNVAVLVLLSAL